MDFLNPREPVSTWSHGLWLLLVLPGTFLLWRRSRGGRAKQLSLLIYGLSLVFCSAASTLYHGVRPAGYRIATFALLDYLAIYFLIAGSYTAIAWNLLRGRWRRGILILVWTWAVAGSALRLACATTLPPWLSTGLYLMMGWGSVFCYVEVARRLSHRALSPVVVGGVLYSVGALINLLGQPVLWPGVFGAHELFHLLVVAGSLAHFWFVLTVVAPYAYEPELSMQLVEG
jgi:hemolysin III